METKKNLGTKMQRVYSIAQRQLHIIDVQRYHVENEHLGYFMTLEDIKKRIVSFDPTEWYKDEKFGDESVSFYDLPVEDQKELAEVMAKLIAPAMSQKDLIDKCIRCGWLCNKFGDKILGIARERREPNPIE